MMTKRLALIVSMIFIAAVALGACATTGKPTAANFKAPKVTLVSFEVPQYDEYWYFAASVKPTKGKAGDRGAFLPMSFLFDVGNPNDFPVLLEGITYTVAFDKDFEVITTNINDSYWIPANKTSQVRVSTLVTVRSALTGLLLANAPALKQRGWDAWGTLEKWWTGVPDLSVPVTVKNAAFTFKADGLIKVVPFEATVP
ncbi:MAG: hypothetical protein JW836_12325 [Deltaproteobacteria bacterium]|nr:hypothetical protein [Deltaproteobacteria bacterium]